MSHFALITRVGGKSQISVPNPILIMPMPVHLSASVHAAVFLLLLHLTCLSANPTIHSNDPFFPDHQLSIPFSPLSSGSRPN
jgi:hypothetical protein